MASNIIYSKSVFARYFLASDSTVTAWANNVLDKLIAKGVVAEFVLREDADGNPTDFEDLFKPVTIYFSYFVQLARQFENFTSSQFLSDQYLQQHGQYSSGNETLVQLVNAINNSLRIRASRGTGRTVLPSVDGIAADGEILRLVGWNTRTFFKLGNARPQYNSWNIGHCSPAYRGNTRRRDLNISYEYTQDVEDVEVYPLINPTSVFHVFYRGLKVMEIEQPGAGQVAGIGDGSIVAKRIVVDPRINFEITFEIAQDITNHNITFGARAYDGSGNQVQLQSIINGANSNQFFEVARLNKAGKFYLVRGILFNSNEPNRSVSDARLNIGFGHNLRMPDNVVSIVPYIVYDNNLAGDSSPTDEGSASAGAASTQSGSQSGDGPYDGQPSIFLHNIKITPASLLYSRAYLNNKNFIDIIFDNKNGQFSDEQIKLILRRYFIPYNTAFNITDLSNLGIIPILAFFVAMEDAGYILLEDGVGRIPLE